MPNVAGGIARVRHDCPGIVFCLEVDGPNTKEEVIELRRILAGKRHGDTLRNQLGCLQEIHTPLDRWFKDVKKGADPIGQPDLVPGVPQTSKIGGACGTQAVR
ncbi:hypothetical protein SMC26_31735 [Actinomadura fulvescens]|uniref:Transposase n=1 Tax=Actinomadura fulvescens TaxID=46160 RepID=A0ABN3Q9L9_9ACTN